MDDDFFVPAPLAFDGPLAVFFVAGLAFLAAALPDLSDEEAFTTFGAAFSTGAGATFFTAFFEVPLAVVVAFLEGALTFPTTTSDPMEGKIVDSSPLDQVTRNNVPLTPVTTPSRGAWPTRFEGTCTLSPTAAIWFSFVFLAPIDTHRSPEAAGGIEPPYGALQAPA